MRVNALSLFLFSMENKKRPTLLGRPSYGNSLMIATLKSPAWELEPDHQPALASSVYYPPKHAKMALNHPPHQEYLP